MLSLSLTHPVHEGEVGLLGLQTFRSHPAREDLHRHRADHVVTPVGVGGGGHPLGGKHGRDLPRTPTVINLRKGCDK